MRFESVAFVALAIPFFIALEALVPRKRMPIRWSALVLATGMLVLNSMVGRIIPTASPTLFTLGRIALAWFTTEVGWYWLHRAMHRVPLLWRVHRMHHRDTPLAWHQSWWIHPLDIAMFAGVAALCTWLVGAPLTSAPIVLLARRVWGILLHANVRWPATFLDHVFVTPYLHHRHHREELPAANFAPSFSILDRVFGTWTR